MNEILCLFIFGKELMEVGNGLDALVEVDEVELFVGGMEVVAVQPEAHEDDLDAELLFEEGADGDAAAAADGDGGFVEDRFDSLCRRPVGLAVDGGHIGLAAVVFFCLDGDASGGDLFEIIQ